VGRGGRKGNRKTRRAGLARVWYHPGMKDESAADRDVGAGSGDPVAGHDGALRSWIDRGVESLLIISDRALEPSRIAEAFVNVAPGTKNDAGDDIDSAAVLEAVERLNAEYESTGRAFRIERVAGGLRLMTTGDHAALIAAFRQKRDTGRLSKPALETLSIIAYEQPITRARLEAIRGVACGEVLKTLLERKLVMIKGRAEELGRPMLYGTTKAFLEVFGLASLKDLPAVAKPPKAGSFEPQKPTNADRATKAESETNGGAEDGAAPDGEPRAEADLVAAGEQA